MSLRIWLVSSQVSPASSRFSACPPTFSSVLCPGPGPRTLGSICPFWSRECVPSKCPPDLACVLQVSPASSRFLKCPPTFSSVPLSRPRAPAHGLSILSFLVTGECPPNVLRIWLPLRPRFLQRPPGFSSVPPTFSSVLCPGLRPPDIGLHLSLLVS